MRDAADASADEDARWLSPILQISDWQIATRQAGPSGATRFAPTRLSAIHVSDGSDAYLVPELTAPDPDAVALVRQSEIVILLWSAESGSLVEPAGARAW